MIEKFTDLLKRGNLPDDDREVPNYLKIKNRQFENVDVSNNNVDELVALSSEEFNEFASSVEINMLLVYLSTMSKSEMQKFYSYLEEVVKLKEGVESPSAKEQFSAAMQDLDISQVTDESRARATLETPLMIKFAKNIYNKIMSFTKYVSQDYYDYNSDDAFKMYEGHLSKIIWDRMDNIPDHFEQVIDHFQKFYNENDEEHQKFFKHLSKRFGLLIVTLNRLVHMTQGRVTSLNWFTTVMVEKELIGDVGISISESKEMTTDKKLINFLALTFAGICDESDVNYLLNLINVVETMFEWYPINREACEYVMVEMMKSVAIKKVNVENANSFIAFFGELPRFYEVLSYDKIYELKELINYTLANEKPQDNEIFDNPEVKNRIILMNYFIDMEDLYYESGK